MANTIKIGNLDISAFKVGSNDCKIYLGDTLLYPQSPTLSYTLLKGIERKAGYLGYVDLGLKVGTDFHIEIQLNYKSLGGGRFFGVDDTFRWFMSKYNDVYHYAYFDYNGKRISKLASKTTDYPLNTDFTVKLDNFQMYTSYKDVYTEGTKQTSYSAATNMCLFSSNITSNGDLAAVYSIKIYTDCTYSGNAFVSGTLVGDFIPVKRNSDNLVTMFNTVTNTFCEAYGSLYPIEITS